MARQARGISLIAAVALVATGGAACSEKKRTEIVLGLATDLTAPTPLKSVHLQVLRLPENVPIGDADFPISGTASQMYGLPGTYAVFSDHGAADRVRVVLTARDDVGATLVVRKALLTLVPEKTLFVRLGVVSACQGKNDCGDDDVYTCVDGRCAAQAIDTSRLPDYHPGDEKQVACTGGATTFIDTDTRLPLTPTGTSCGAGTCQEGVCLAPPSAPDGGPADTSDASAGADRPDATEAGGDVAPPTVIPQLTSLVPAVGTAGTSVSIELHGADIAPPWSIVFDGTPVATTYGQAADGPTAVGTVVIGTAIATGQVPVSLASDARHSNTVYFTVTPAAGAPTIVDYTPDNALPGTQISIVGTNLVAEPVTITDALGRQILVVATGTTTWVGAAVDRVDIVIPSGLGSGVLTASNSKGSFRGRVFNVGQNLARLAGVVATASTQYNTTNWAIASGSDNNLQTSWFSAHGDCATLTTCTTVPFFQVAFPTPQLIGRIAMRGNREYATGYDFVEGTFTILDANGVSLWSEDRLLPDPDRDLDIVIAPSIAGAAAVKFSSISDQSDEPGFSELEVFGP